MLYVLWSVLYNVLVRNPTRETCELFMGAVCKFRCWYASCVFDDTVTAAARVQAGAG